MLAPKAIAAEDGLAIGDETNGSGRALPGLPEVEAVAAEDAASADAPEAGPFETDSLPAPFADDSGNGSGAALDIENRSAAAFAGRLRTLFVSGAPALAPPVVAGAGSGAPFDNASLEDPAAAAGMEALVEGSAAKAGTAGAFCRGVLPPSIARIIASASVSGVAGLYEEGPAAGAATFADVFAWPLAPPVRGVAAESCAAPEGSINN